ncbi:hypothetical protein D3C81_1494320 [compost metagenome]
MEEFMHHISPYFGKTSHGEQIVHIDQVLAEHRHEAAEHKHFIRQADIRYAVAAADTYHGSVEARFIRLLRFAVNVRMNVMCDKRTCLLGVLNHLRYRTGFAFRNEEDVVADDINVLVIDALQLIVGHDPFAAFLFHIELTDELGAFDPSRPNDRISFQFLAFAKLYAGWRNAGDLGARNDFYVHLVQSFRSFLDQFVRQDRQDFRSHIGDDQTNLARINKELFAELVTEFGQFANQFHAGEAGTYHDEG